MLFDVTVTSVSVQVTVTFGAAYVAPALVPLRSGKALIGHVPNAG
ncbi:unannotated protein [freshwater metagenome]|uniref:Unannotated protein n=1 Tax=freshwater metagenome TaxID=449393 RepID=A0A6J6JRB8_9ZZZZ